MMSLLEAISPTARTLLHINPSRKTNMSKTRIKKTLMTIPSRTDAEAAMNELALVENNRRKAIAERDDLILSITEDAQPKIERCEERVAELTDALRAWAEGNPLAFGNRKSLDLGAGTLGFRTGTPKLALLSRLWNWEKVLAAIKARHWINFVRTKEEVDKDYMLGYVSTHPSTHGFDAVGVKVVQDESFFIEPNLTDLDARQTVKA
jgi:phage host-nuclease inhibitor protein Gam